MTSSSCPLTGRLLVGLAMVCATWTVQAGLTALVEDASDGSLRVVEIDSANGQVMPGSAAIEDCCLVGAGLTAVDAAGDRVFALGVRTAGDQVGQPALVTLSLDGSEAFYIEPDQLPRAVMAYDSVSGRLIGATFPAEGTQWISLDPNTGQVDTIGNASEDCCEIVSGLAAVGNLPAGSRGLYFIGRDYDSSQWRLLAMRLDTGQIDNLAELPAGSPGFLVLDEQTGQLDVLIQTALDEASALYRIDPAIGPVTLVATQTVAGCCLLSPGDVASLDMTGEFWWVGGSGSNLSPPAPGYFALAASIDAAVVPDWQLEAGYRLHALIVSGAVVNPGLLFRDRFEP